MSDTWKLILILLGVILFVAVAPAIIFIIGSVLSPYISTLGFVALVFLVTVVLAYRHKKSKEDRKNHEDLNH